MEFILKYAKENTDQSISVYGQKKLISHDELFSYLANNGGVDILAVFDGDRNNQKAPKKFFVKTSLMPDNRVEGFDIDFPVVINLISDFDDVPLHCG